MTQRRTDGSRKVPGPTQGISAGLWEFHVPALIRPVGISAVMERGPCRRGKEEGVRGAEGRSGDRPTRPTHRLRGYVHRCDQNQCKRITSALVGPLWSLRSNRTQQRTERGESLVTIKIDGLRAATHEKSKTMLVPLPVSYCVLANTLRSAYRVPWPYLLCIILAPPPGVLEAGGVLFLGARIWAPF